MEGNRCVHIWPYVVQPGLIDISDSWTVETGQMPISVARSSSPDEHLHRPLGHGSRRLGQLRTDNWHVYIFSSQHGLGHLARALTWLYPQRGNRSQGPMMDSFLCSCQNETDGYYEVEEAE